MSNILKLIAMAAGTTILSLGAYAQEAPAVERKLEKISTIHSQLKPSKTVLLYPDGQAGNGKKAAKLAKTDKGYAAMLGPGDSNGYDCDEEARKNGFIAYVADSARVDLYFPEHPNGQMVLSTPGGSYKDLSTWNEGTYVAEWMLKRGITVGVVKYRLPHGHWTIPLTDVQNAFRYCRAHADDWGIDQIGIIGFSAGGHLASTVTTMYTDSLTRPDFSVLIYPVISTDPAVTHRNTKGNLIGFEEYWNDRENYSFSEYYERQKTYEELKKKYSSENNVTATTPQSFIALSTDDGLVPAQNSLLYFQALAKNKVSSEIHLYPYGGHGWGFTDPAVIDVDKSKDALGNSRVEFSASLERWLSDVHRGKIDVAEKRPDSPIELPESQTVLLYPNGQETSGESNGAEGPEVVDDRYHFMNVGDSARFDLYMADKSIATGQMVVICPGGGYKYSAQRNEGEYVVNWLLKRGLSACLLKYRLPLGHWNVPLTDVQNTFRWIRAHADELGVKQVGVMGFSAGGHLAASASVLYTDQETRPDFSVLFYPVITMERGVTHNGTRANLIGKDNQWGGKKAQHEELLWKYSLENQVTEDTPRTIIILCSDDPTVPAENSIRYFMKLAKLKVKAEMHSFPQGGHGWGFRNSEIGTDGVMYARSEIDAALERFLKESINY
ncbi:MAG: alpha/beta hydrolase [Bacteroidales bacterium]|nr:alpha/beta hydrolase [Bacteroidales bacterium]